MSKTKSQHKALEPWEYYYWSEIPYSAVKKRHKTDANRRQRHIDKQTAKLERKNDYGPRH